MPIQYVNIIVPPLMSFRPLMISSRYNGSQLHSLWQYNVYVHSIFLTGIWAIHLTQSQINIFPKTLLSSCNFPSQKTSIVLIFKILKSRTLFSQGKLLCHPHVKKKTKQNTDEGSISGELLTKFINKNHEAIVMLTKKRAE